MNLFQNSLIHLSRNIKNLFQENSQSTLGQKSLEFKRLKSRPQNLAHKKNHLRTNLAKNQRKNRKNPKKKNPLWKIIQQEKNRHIILKHSLKNYRLPHSHIIHRQPQSQKI